MLRNATGLLCLPAGELRRTVTQQRCLDWAAGVGRLEPGGGGVRRKGVQNMLRKATVLLCLPAGELRRTVTQQRCLDWAAGIRRLEITGECLWLASLRPTARPGGGGVRRKGVQKMLRKVTGLLCPPAGEIRRTVTQQRCLDWAAGVGRLEWVVELEVPGSGKRSAELFKELLAAAPSRFDSEVNTFVFLKTRHVCLGSLRSSDRANAEDVRQATDLVSFVCRETNAAVGPLVLSSLLTAQ
eukprot:gene6313-9673_t